VSTNVSAGTQRCTMFGMQRRGSGSVSHSGDADLWDSELTWTSFSLRETRFTISRRAALSGFGFELYADSRITLSLALLERSCQLECKVNWSLNSPRGAWGRVPRRGSTYAVRFLFPLGCRSSSALGCIGSDPRIDELSEALGRPELLFGELSCSS